MTEGANETVPYVSGDSRKILVKISLGKFLRMDLRSDTLPYTMKHGRGPTCTCHHQEIDEYEPIVVLPCEHTKERVLVKRDHV